MSNTDPFAEHEAHLDEHRATRDDLLRLLEELDAAPEDKRGDKWWGTRDEIAGHLRDVENTIRSGELARNQVEGFAAAMAPVTITQEQPAAPDKPEE